jgi:hypothetical protein
MSNEEKGDSKEGQGTGGGAGGQGAGGPGGTKRHKKNTTPLETSVSVVLDSPVTSQWAGPSASPPPPKSARFGTVPESNPTVTLGFSSQLQPCPYLTTTTPQDVSTASDIASLKWATIELARRPKTSMLTKPDVLLRDYHVGRADCVRHSLTFVCVGV